MSFWRDAATIPIPEEGEETASESPATAWGEAGAGGGSKTVPTISIAAGDRENVLTIAPPTGVAAATFNVYWSASPQVTPLNGTKISAVTSPFTHNNLTNGTPIFYVATAISAAGEGAASAVAGGMPGKWTELLKPPASPLPPPREGHTAVYNAGTDRMVVFGGRGVNLPLNDYWVLQTPKTNPAWSQFITSGPQPRLGHSAVYNSGTNRMTVFGGATTSDGSFVTNELWSAANADASVGLPVWTIPSSGTPPDPRSEHAGVYDAAGDKMIVFGGIVATGLSKEVWALSGATSPSASWREVFPSGGGPSARCCMAAAYDPAGRRLIVFGGFGGTGPAGSILFSDLWTLTFDAAFSTATWKNLTPSGGTPPPLRCCAASLWDGSKLLLFGGGEIGTPSDNKLHALILQTTTYATAVGPAGPVSRIFPTAVPAGKFLLFGGSGASGPLNDLWRLD